MSNLSQKELTKLSKFMSLVLRHKPETINIEMDTEGWVGVDDLLNKTNAHGIEIDAKTLNIIVETNTKKRFAFNDDKSKIRANQGHSLKVDLNYAPKAPPEILYHGTGSKYVESIFEKGLQKMQRHHVHLSEEYETAYTVGARHGKPKVLIVGTTKMTIDGFTFYESENGVWLVDEVPPKYLKYSDGEV